MALFKYYKVKSSTNIFFVTRVGLPRDAGVKKACTKMLATRWIQQADDNLLEFLERLDVMSSNVADDVLQAFFAYRGDILGGLVFNGMLKPKLPSFILRGFSVPTSNFFFFKFC